MRTGSACRAVCFALLLLPGLPAMGHAQTSRAEPKPLWIAVTAPGFVKTIGPLARHRAGEGFDIRILDDTTLRTERQRAARDVEPIRRNVRELVGKSPGRRACLVLVGFEPGRQAPARGKEKFALPGGVGTADNMAGRPSDAVIADLNGDDRPDVAIGRLPARDEPELVGMIGKILRFESQTRPADWQHRFVVLGGAPNYGAVIDRMIEMLVGAALDRLNGRWTGKVFYSNPNSMFSLPREELRSGAIAAMERGAAMNLYMGHSGAGGFFLRRANLEKLTVPVGAGPLVALSCSGAVQGGGADGFAVTAVRNATGPVATFAAGGISYPHWNRLLAEGLEKSFFNARPTRLDEVIDGMWRNLATGHLDVVTLVALNLADGSEQDFPVQRRGHLQMYSLFGDPATRLPWTLGRMTLAGPAKGRPGQRVRLVGRLGDRRLDRAKVKVLLRRPYTAIPPPTDAAESPSARHARVNRVELATAEAEVAGDGFEVTVKLPEGAAFPFVVVRAWAAGEGDVQAVGSCRIELTNEREE